MTNAHLDICLLGPPTVHLNGDNVTGFVSRSSQALFYFLATTGQRHNRLWLASLLWPDVSEAAARKNLRDIISNLRKLFGNALHITHDTAHLDITQPHAVDVQIFESLFQRWNKEANPHALQQMTTLYRGEFLEGFHLPGSVEFESWLLAERERLRDRVMWAMDILVDLALQQHDNATGLALSRRMLALEPWREKAHRQRMRLLEASGQRSAALAQYEQCKTYLQNEFGVEPMVETTRLYEEVRTNQSDSAAQRPLMEFTASGAPIRTHPRCNLPRLFTPLFGREQEIAAVVERLRQRDCGLVTLVGGGGVGKTRLALAAAEQLVGDFPDGVWFVPLAGLTSCEDELGATTEETIAEAIGAAIARAMHFPLQAGDPVFVQVLDALRVQKSLLLLDNFEHLSAFAPIVLRIMEACRYTSILVTSRHRLRLQAEWVFVVSGLPIPETHRPLDGGDVDLFARRYSSLQLFRERAQRAGADFSLQDDEIEAVLTICRLLEGLPLGIELAAGLTTELSPTQIAAELQRSHHILTTEMADIPPRHRSLQALFDFSWRLLSPAEQQMIAICAIFTDRFSGAAATAISSLSHEHLQALVQKSLLRQLEDDRFVMQPVVRQWAHEKLAQNASRLAETKRAHQNYFLGLLADFAARLGNDPAVTSAVQPEFAHILTAWRFAIEQKNIEILGQNAKGMSQLLSWHGTHQEGAQYFIRAIECTQALRTQPNPPDHLLTVLGRLLVEAAFFHSRAGQLDLARSEAREAMVIAQQIGDRSLEIDSLKNLAYAAWFSGNLEEGETYIKEELRLARLEGELAAEAYGLGGVAIIAQHRGLIGQAIEGYELALDIAQAAGETLLALLLANHLGAAYLAQGGLWLADVHFQSLLPLRRRAGDVLGEGVTLLSLSQTNLALGDPMEAARNGQAALAIFQQIVAHRHESQALSHLAHTHRQMGDQETAYAYAQQALQITDAHPMTPARAKALLALGAVFTAQGQLHSAQTAFTEAIRLAEQLQEANMVACAQVRCARVLLALQQHRAAQQLVEDVMPQLAKLSNDWTVDPVGIYVQCYTVLNAVGNPTAHLLLDAGHRLLCQQTEQISDESARKRFLYNIPSHQEILRLWEKQTRRRAPTP